MKRMMAVLVLLAACSAATSWAQSGYPNRPLRLILSVPPGGAADYIGRVVAAKLADFLGENVVIDSRIGAGGIVASLYVTKATPDGHTLFLSSSTTHGVAPVLYRKLPYDAIKGFTHVSLIVIMPAIMAIHTDVPAKTVKEFIAVAKAKPGALRFPSSGNGSVPQLFGEQFKMVTGTNLVHVPYKGSGPAVVGLASGEAHVMWDGLPSLIGQIKAGRLRPIAAMHDKRLAVFPDVPTAAEAGLKGMEGGIWYGLSAPPGLPKVLVDRLNKEIRRVVAQPDVLERFATVGGIAAPTTPQGYVEFILKENKKWGEIVRVSGAQVD
ncbi:MAG TPA: tripartite tricarboxylate transporter substrate binding protein [Burkholderiales bacterium]|nr:tripartite tricarboxylate transporter substrate binding protein [Burkholderiales bacterium]